MRAHDIISYSIVSILGLGLTAAPAQASSTDVALGSQGELYRVQVGTYGDLFPGGHDDQPADMVLALDVVHPGGGDTERRLVPGTIGNNVESAASLFYEDGSKSVFMVWESRVNPLHSVLNLTAMGEDGRFSDVVTISGDRYSFKSSPRIAVSHDTFELPGPDGSSEPHRRSIVQTVWWETTGTEERAVYAPVVLMDGTYLGWNPVFLLDDLAAQSSGDHLTDSPASDALAHSPSIALGDSTSVAVATFVNSGSGRLNTLEIDVLPIDLTTIAALVRTKILGYPRIPSPIAPLADAVRNQILAVGVNLHPSLRSYLAEETRAQIVEIGSRYNPGQIRRLAETVRAQIVEIGATAFGGRGFGRLPNLAIADVFATPDAEPTPGAPGHALAVRTAKDLPVPETGAATTAPTVFTSATGDAVLISWLENDKIFYRESTAAGWTDPLSLDLSPTFTREQAEQVLRQRVRNH